MIKTDTRMSDWVDWMGLTRTSLFNSVHESHAPPSPVQPVEAGVLKMSWSGAGRVHVAMRTRSVARREAALAKARARLLAVLSGLEVVWAVCPADNLSYAKKRVVSRTCKTLRDMNREFRARRSAWFHGLMREMRVLPWLVKDWFTYEHGRRIETVNRFIIRWVEAQDRRAQRYLCFKRRMDTDSVDFEIEDCRDESLVDSLGHRKAHLTTNLKMQVTFQFSGAVSMKFSPIKYHKLSWYTRDTGPTSDSLFYDDSGQYQEVQVKTWEDVRKWITSREVVSKPLDKSLVPGW